MPTGLAREVAEAVGSVLGAPPGRVWVRVSGLPLEQYAENGVAHSELPLPVFVTVLHSELPVGAALGAEARALSVAIADVVGRSSEWVHVEYSPPGKGRVAFGGHLVQ